MQIDRKIISNNPDKELFIEVINQNFKNNQLIDFWNKLNKNIIIKENAKEWPKDIFFCKDKYIDLDNPEGIIMYYDGTFKCFYVDYKIWSISKSKFCFNEQNNKSFFKDMMYKDYKLKLENISGYQSQRIIRTFKNYKLNIAK